MVAAARRCDRVAVVALKFRCTSEAATVRRLVEEGGRGEIYCGWTTYLSRCGELAHAEAALGRWGSNGVRFLDVLWWLRGCPTPTRVSGATDAAFDPEGPPAGIALPRRRSSAWKTWVWL